MNTTTDDDEHASDLALDMNKWKEQDMLDRLLIVDMQARMHVTLHTCTNATNKRCVNISLSAQHETADSRYAYRYPCIYALMILQEINEHEQIETAGYV